MRFCTNLLLGEDKIKYFLCNTIELDAIFYRINVEGMNIIFCKYTTFLTTHFCLLEQELNENENPSGVVSNSLGVILGSQLSRQSA